MALNGFSRSTVSTVSHQRRHHPCSSWTHRRNLIFPSADSLRRRRKYWHAIGAALGQQRPGDARHLVGKCNRHHSERSAGEKPREPGILLRLLSRELQHRMGSDHQNASQISVALFRDWPELLLAASRILPWH